MSLTIQRILDEISTLPEFVNRRVEVNTRGIFGNYPIHAARTWQDTEVVDLLLKNGANIDSIGEGGETPIFRPIWDNCKDFVEFLLSRGARIDIPNDDGLTPIDAAKLQGFEDIVKVFDRYRRNAK